MDLKQLRYFAAIIDEGGMRRAADGLHVSQPALTVAVKQLEAALGVSLFSRTGRTLEPTREGYRLYAHARALLAQAEKAKSEMRALASLEVADLPLAATGMIANHVLARPISRFLGQHPGVKISLLQMGGPAVESALKLGEVEIGFAMHELDAGFEQVPVFSNQVAVCLRADHPAAARDTISWSDLLDLPVATLPRSYTLHARLLKEARRHSKSANIVLESDAMGPLTAAIEDGTAVGLLMEAAKPAGDHIKALPITENKGYHFSLNACWRKDMPLSVAGQALVGFLQENKSNTLLLKD
ncbi:LysR family transcriptional regulator [Kordiimonas aestuarii]|uniref:LysR family transcriptional regulator n=1 Tax=Kordiimonas aestuarii TaxID=1005925 RepID=UPI0021D2B06F|nr:LysR family transcriptional regulator [Kordiimonas aestuarii]